MMMDKTCLTCRHWQTAKPDRHGEQKPTARLRHKLAPCALGKEYNSLPYKTPACNKYQAISPAALARREQKIQELQRGPNH